MGEGLYAAAGVCCEWLKPFLAQELARPGVTRPRPHGHGAGLAVRVRAPNAKGVVTVPDWAVTCPYGL